MAFGKNSTARLFLIADITFPIYIKRLNNIRKSIPVLPYDDIYDRFHLSLLDFHINLNNPNYDIFFSKEFKTFVKKCFEKYIEGIKLEEYNFNPMGKYFYTLQYIPSFEKSIINNVSLCENILSNRILSRNNTLSKKNILFKIKKNIYWNHPLKRFKKCIWEWIEQKIGKKEKQYEIKYDNRGNITRAYYDLYAVPSYYWDSKSIFHISFFQQFPYKSNIINSFSTEEIDNKIYLKRDSTILHLRKNPNNKIYIDKEKPIPFIICSKGKKKSVDLRLTLSAHNSIHIPKKIVTDRTSIPKRFKKFNFYINDIL